MFTHPFTRRFSKSVAGTTLAAATLGITALITAGTAGAGTVDDGFIAQLGNDGITPPGTPVPVTLQWESYRSPTGISRTCNACSDGPRKASR